MNKELVSVIITTYNVSKYIEKTILSVLNQTYGKVELIIIDDGSTDETVKILRDYLRNPKIKIFFRHHTGNIGKNLNDCIRISAGNVIGVLGADDIWLPNKIEVQMEYLKNEKIVCSNFSVIDGHDKVTYKRVGNYSEDFYLDLRMLLQSNCILASSILAYKEVLFECGLFDESVGHRSEDYYLWLNIASKYKIKYINKLLTNYRIHGDNLTIKSFDDRRGVLLRNLEILEPYLTHPDKEIRYSANLGICILYVRLIKIYYSEGDISKSYEYCKLLVSNYEKRTSSKFLKYVIFFVYLCTLRILERFFNIEGIVKKIKIVRV